MQLPYIIQGDNIVIFYDNKPTSIAKTHINYDAILSAIKNNDWDSIAHLIDIPKSIDLLSGGLVSVRGGKIFYIDSEINEALSTRIISLHKSGFNISHMLKFVENLYRNPSNRAVNELYKFLESNELPITDDGYFLAYKKVRHDYKDVHSGTIDNSVGVVVEMPRYAVDDNRDNLCSRGLHFCGFTYLRHFGGSRVVVLKINPADVVSIPSDYNNQKGRCCKYTVVAEVPLEAAVQDDCLSAVGPVVTVDNDEVVKAPTVSERHEFRRTLKKLTDEGVDELVNGLIDHDMVDYDACHFNLHLTADYLALSTSDQDFVKIKNFYQSRESYYDRFN